MSPGRYFYLTTIPDQDTDLIGAECRALTGCVPNPYGIAISDRRVDVKRGAYVKSCMEILFEGGSVAEICAQIKSAELHADDFRVTVFRLPRNLNRLLAAEIRLDERPMRTAHSHDRKRKEAKRVEAHRAIPVNEPV